MNFVLKTLSDTLTVSRMANLHFFEFSEKFATRDDHHPFFELIFVSSGVLQVKSEEYTGLLQKDEMIIHRPDSVHSLYCPSKSPTVIIIGFECNSTSLNYFANHAVKLTETEKNKLSVIVKEGRSIFAPPYDVPTYDMKKKSAQPYGAEQMLKIQLECFLIELVRKYTYHELSDFKNAHLPFMINELVDYINENFLEKTTIHELSFMFCTNRSTLCSSFKKATGKTLLEYITDKKLALAKDKILHTELTFTEIAEKMNFDSVHNFTRFFKTKVGMTPKEYRNNFKSQREPTRM